MQALRKTYATGIGTQMSGYWTRLANSLPNTNLMAKRARKQSDMRSNHSVAWDATVKDIICSYVVAEVNRLAARAPQADDARIRAALSHVDLLKVESSLSSTHDVNPANQDPPTPDILVAILAVGPNEDMDAALKIWDNNTPHKDAILAYIAYQKNCTIL
jgi:hypothetical protein